MAVNTMKAGVLNGTIPSAVSDTGATSSAFLMMDLLHQQGKLSTTVFHLLDRAVSPAATVNKLLHNEHKLTHSVTIVPFLVANSLFSTSNFVKAGYTAIYDKNEVNYYNMHTTRNTVLTGVVLKE